MPQASTSRSAETRCWRSAVGSSGIARLSAGRRAAAASSAASGCHAERHRDHLAALVDEDVVQLQVEVRNARLVGVGHAAQQAGDPGRRLLDQRRRMLSQPFVERHAGTAIDGDEGPVLMDAELGDRGDVRMVELGGAPSREQPVAKAVRTVGRQPRHTTASPSVELALSVASQVIVASLLPSRRWSVKRPKARIGDEERKAGATASGIAREGGVA